MQYQGQRGRLVQRITHQHSLPSRKVTAIIHKKYNVFNPHINTKIFVLILSEKTQPSLTEKYYARYLLRYVRCHQYEARLAYYLKMEQHDLCKGALLVSQWEYMSQGQTPEWGEIDKQLNQLKMRALKLFEELDKTVSFRQYMDDDEERKRKKITAVMKTIFQDGKFQSDTEADSLKTDWKEIKNAYYIGEVEGRI